MPMIPVDTDPGLRGVLGTEQKPKPIPDIDAVIGAAFQQYNPTVSAFQELRYMGQFRPDPNHNPMDLIAGTDYFRQHAREFIGSRSEAETRAIMRRIDGENADRTTLDAAGGWGTVMGMVAGLVDPTIAMPGRVALGAAREGATFGRAAVEVGLAGAAQAGVQEAVLQGTQKTRPFGESVESVGSATLLSALLGGAAARLLSPAEHARVVDGLDKARAEMDAHAGNAPPRSAPQVYTIDNMINAEGPVDLKVLRGANGSITVDTGVSFVDITPFINRGMSVEEAIARSFGDHPDPHAPDVSKVHAKAAADTVYQPQPAGGGVGQSVGAAAADTRALELVPTGLEKVPGLGWFQERMNPLQRVFSAASTFARRTMADLAEFPGLFKENLEGKPTTDVAALDRLAGMELRAKSVAISDTLHERFSDYYFGEQKSFPGARAALDQVTGAAEGRMNYDRFKEQVADALRNGDTHETPQVQEAAQWMRKNVFDPWKERAAKAGILDPEVQAVGAESYLQRIYNKQAIAANRDGFVNKVVDWLTSDQNTKRAAQDRLRVLQKQLQDTEERIARAEANRQNNVYVTLIPERDRIIAKIEEEIAAWEGKTADQARSALKAREKYEALQAKRDIEFVREGEGVRVRENLDKSPPRRGEGRLEGADSAIHKAMDDILASDREITTQELRDRAHEITDRILSSADGRIPYDLHMGGPRVGFRGEGGPPPRGPLAARDFAIPDNTIRDFLVNDAEEIARTHLRTMVPDTLLAERFSDVDLSVEMRQINEEYARLTDAAGTSEARKTELEKERQSVITAIAGVRDRIRHVYGLSPQGPMRNAARVVGGVKVFNVLTSMGMAAISSMQDAAGAVFRHGLTTTFNDAWAPWISHLMGDETWAQSKSQIRTLGIASEVAISARSRSLDDALELYRPQSQVERTLQWAADRFQILNGLAAWTDWAKTTSSLTAGSEILRAARAAAEGTATAKQLRTLGESNITPNLAERIWKQFQDGGGDEIGGGRFPNTADWKDKTARSAFEAAVSREADIAVVTPGQDKPLWLSDPIMSVFGQFKSFTASSTQRMLLANLQRRDAQVLQGLMFSLGLGMITYKANSLLGGQPTSDKPQDWIKEAISRGGLLGWFEEGNALASKATGGGVDIYRLIGAEKPLSRYASRNAMDQLLGPTAGKIDSILKVTRAAAKQEWNESDTKAVRKLTTGQNLFYLRGLFNKAEEGINNAFGIDMRVKPNEH